MNVQTEIESCEKTKLFPPFSFSLDVHVWQKHVCNNVFSNIIQV
jgi:hypothetical protein